MTPFLKFCLQYSNVIHLEQSANQFWCGDIEKVLCQTCPNQSVRGNLCNTFSPNELNYLYSNYPELLI